MIRRQVLSFAFAAIAAAATLAAGPALAGEKRAFDQASFAAAQSAGKPVLVEITAPWCSTCRAQKPIIAALAADPAFSGLTVFEVDFDNQKDVVRALGARSQSTLIMFRGNVETARSVGDTDPGRIGRLVASGFAS